MPLVPLGEWGVGIAEMKIGEGWDCSAWPGLLISLSSWFTILSLELCESHFMKSWSIWPLAIWNLVFLAYMLPASWSMSIVLTFFYFQKFRMFAKIPVILPLEANLLLLC